MTETDVCNLALGMLGHDRVIEGDFRVNAGAEAKRCRLFFDASRRAVLSSPRATWFFAQESLRLCGEPCSEECGSRTPRWVAALPADCLSVVRVHRPGDPGTHVGFGHYQGTRLICGASDVEVVYVRDVSDPSEWPQHPLDAWAAELASRLAGPMGGGNAEKVRLAKDGAKAALIEAAAWNALQRPAPPKDWDRYAASRNGGRR